MRPKAQKSLNRSSRSCAEMSQCRRSCSCYSDATLTQLSRPTFSANCNLHWVQGGAHVPAEHCALWTWLRIQTLISVKIQGLMSAARPIMSAARRESPPSCDSHCSKLYTSPLPSTWNPCSWKLCRSCQYLDCVQIHRTTAAARYMTPGHAGRVMARISRPLWFISSLHQAASAPLAHQLHSA